MYYLGVQNVLAGLDADMQVKRHHLYPEDRDEMIRRLAELTNLLMDVGIILVATVSELTFDERETFRMSVSPIEVQTIWVGSTEGSDIEADYTIKDAAAADDYQGDVMKLLKDSGVGK